MANGEGKKLYPFPYLLFVVPTCTLLLMLILVKNPEGQLAAIQLVM